MKKSKLGVFIVGIYLLISIAAAIYAATCNGMFCGLVLVGPVMPWPFLLEGIVKNSYPLYFVLVALNSVILYFVGLGLSRIFSSQAN